MRPFANPAATALPALIGCDEVGRGALCGPVVVAAVWFDPAAFPVSVLACLDDSKKLDRPTRERLTPLIREHARVTVAAGSRELVDRINVRAATLLAMCRAHAGLGVEPCHALIDGRDVPSPLLAKASAVVAGDARSLSIAAASIVAKTLRDGLMRALARRHPAYAWDSNVGYGTRAHLAGLASLGRSAHHRVSFTGRYGSPVTISPVTAGRAARPSPPRR